jgi:hypothetical protein
MVRKTVMASVNNNNHDDGDDSDNNDDHKGQMLTIAKVCCQTHKSKN